jgi:hypothetical protein
MIQFLRTAAIVFVVGRAAQAADVIWWEAEKPAATNFPDRTWFSAKNAKERDVLSGGAWISSAGKREGDALFLRYTVAVPADGDYAFWARKFWKHGPFRWRFDDGPWRTCGRDVALADSVSLRKFVGANWVSLGKVTLAAGRHTLRVELLAKPGEKTTAAFDCFVLTTGAFTPRGKLKPGAKLGRAPAGWFAFEPDPDTFDGALLDLRSMNEKAAGQSGFVRAKDDGFALGDGTPVRFWAVNCGPNTIKMDDTSVDYLARKLAKLGVNMVRFHGAIYDRNAADPVTIDRAFLAKLHRFVAAMKRQGIYTKLSFYFPLWFNVRPEYGYRGWSGKGKPFAQLFFHPDMQRIYRSWAKGLLTTKNPHTGLPLGRDPAVAIVEIINEDNYFFWTFKPYKAQPPGTMVWLEKAYGSWLAKKYGSLEKASAAWNGAKVQGDDFAAGRAGLYGAWQMTRRGEKHGNRRRIQDQARFLTEYLRAFFAGMRRHFREDLGVRCLVSATNWKTADDVRLGALDHYAWAACEVMDRHGYFGGPHKGPRASYSLSEGDTYKDRCALLEPQSLPVAQIQCAGHPSIISEINWPMPNRFRADMPWLCALYGSLQGTDGFFHFAVGTAGWLPQHPKFSVSTPVMLGQFPACAVVYRKGYVETGPVVVREAVTLADLYALKGTAASEPQNLDALRAADVPPGGMLKTDRPDSVDPLAHYVGQVVRIVGEEPGESQIRDLSKFVDRTKKTIRSATGELIWDYGRGVVAFNTSRAQGAAGFLDKANAIKLGDVTIRCGNEYAAIAVVSLDGAPLRTSKRMLVQAMTEDANYGWQTAPAGGGMKRITSVGGPPIVVRNIDATVTIARPDAATLTVTPLDANGRRKGDLPAGGTIKLLPDCLYYLVTR